MNASIGRERETLKRSIALLQAKRERAADGSDSAARIDAKLVQANAQMKQLDRAQAVSGVVSGEREIHTGSHWLDHGIEKWKKNPGLMAYKLQSSGYKFSWLLIPLSLPFMWLLFFWKRDSFPYLIESNHKRYKSMEIRK